MIWTHCICEMCWADKHPNREPFRMKERPLKVCCFCGRPTYAGIYVREHPNVVQEHCECKED